MNYIVSSTVLPNPVIDINGKYQGKRASVLNVEKGNLLNYDVLVKPYRDR